MSPLKEIRQKQLELKLLNPTYKSLEAFDFEGFEKILKTLKHFKTNKDFLIYKRDLLKEVMEGTNDLPVLYQHTDGDLFVVEGLTKLLTYKLLSISPCVRISNESPMKLAIKLSQAS